MGEETMGMRLKRIRQQAGLSQADLAKAADIPVGTLRNWEQGIRAPLFDTAAKIARALDVSLDDLAGIRRRGSSQKSKKSD